MIGILFFLFHAECVANEDKLIKFYVIVMLSKEEENSDIAKDV